LKRKEILKPYNMAWLAGENMEDNTEVIGGSESQDRHNTMTKSKGTKRQAMVYKTLHRQLQIDQQRTPENTGSEHMCFGIIGMFCSTAEINMLCT
jgi:hypothetical protein